MLCSKYFKRYIERELHKSKARRQWHPLSGWKELKKERFYPNEHRPWTAEYKAMNPFHQRTPKTLFVEPIKKWDVYTGDRVSHVYLLLLCFVNHIQSRVCALDA